MLGIAIVTMILSIFFINIEIFHEEKYIIEHKDFLKRKKSNMGFFILFNYLKYILISYQL